MNISLGLSNSPSGTQGVPMRNAFYGTEAHRAQSFPGQNVLREDLFQSLSHLMMVTMAAMMNTVAGQISQLNQTGAAVPGQNPNFGGASGLSNGTSSFLGGNTSNTGGTGKVGAASGNLVTRQGKQLDSSIAGNFDAMVAAAKKDGVNLTITSANRSRAEQEKLYAAYKAGKGNLAAKPGTSNHEKGQAIDFGNTPGAWNWLAKNAEKFGFKNLKGEPWHYSPTGG